MRVTNQMMIDNAIRHMSENLESLNRLREKVATNQQFQSASDDPINASISLNLRSSLRSLESYSQTTDLAKDWMNATDFAMQEMEKVAQRAINLVTRGLTDSLTAEERANAIAPEIDSLLSQALEIANTSENGRYIFSGFKIDGKAFTQVDSNTIVYNGDQGIMQRSLGPGQSVSINIVGDQAFSAFFQTLIQARNALNSNDTATLRTTLDGLQSGLETMDRFRTGNGARMRQVSSAADYLDRIKIETKSLLSKKEEINLAEGISLLRGQETTYQAVLEVSQRAISAMSLFDYLR